jgi:RNA polymerase sigma factor (sigma-70 family)
MVRPDEDLDQRCAEVTDRLMARHAWQLIDRAEFARRTRAAMAEQVDGDLQYVAYGVYNLALYDACSGVNGPDARERGYTELYRLLYERAWRSYNDVCEDATQQAITEVITRFESCREPRAFIFFALQYLMGAARSLRRRSGRTESLEREVGDEGLTLGDTVADQLSIEDEAVTREQRLALHSFLARYVCEYPRARKQIDAVRLKYLVGLDDERISRELGVSVPNVHVLRSRGLSRLRSAPGWSQTWEHDL